MPMSAKGCTLSSAQIAESSNRDVDCPPQPPSMPALDHPTRRGGAHPLKSSKVLSCNVPVIRNSVGVNAKIEVEIPKRKNSSPPPESRWERSTDGNIKLDNALLLSTPLRRANSNATSVIQGLTGNEAPSSSEAQSVPRNSPNNHSHLSDRRGHSRQRTWSGSLLHDANETRALHPASANEACLSQSGIRDHEDAHVRGEISWSFRRRPNSDGMVSINVQCNFQKIRRALFIGAYVIVLAMCFNSALRHIIQQDDSFTSRAAQEVAPSRADDGRGGFRQGNSNTFYAKTNKQDAVFFGSSAPNLIQTEHAPSTTHAFFGLVSAILLTSFVFVRGSQQIHERWIVIRQRFDEQRRQSEALDNDLT